MNEEAKVKVEKKVKKGGIMIVNTSLSHVPFTRDDINYLKIPFNELAQQLSQPAFINVMAIGVLLETTGILKSDSVIKAMREMSKNVSAKKAALLPNNIESFEFGTRIIKKQLVTA